MDLVQKARVATKLEKEMSASPSTPALKRGLRKTQERPLTPGNLRKNNKTSKKVLDIAQFFEPSKAASKSPNTKQVTYNNNYGYQTSSSTTFTQQMSGQAARPAQPIGRQETDHLTKNTRNEPTRAMKSEIDQNPATGGHFMKET